MRVSVGRLRVRVTGAAGSEHRVRPIVRRAVELMAERLRADGARATTAGAPARVGGLNIPPLAADLRHLSDEAAAARLADAIYRGVARATARR
jgi:hypothetical protein